MIAESTNANEHIIHNIFTLLLVLISLLIVANPDNILKQNIETLKLEIDEVEKGGYEHFMLKEIFEQPKNIKDALRGRILNNPERIKISSVEEFINKFEKTKRLVFISCGTSWHASLLAEYYFEELARIPVEVEYASEFRYRNPIINQEDIIIPVSQSGESKYPRIFRR